MIAFAVNINAILLVALLILAFSLGYLLRSAQLKKQQRKIYELENEMLNNHAQILELEKRHAKLMELVERLQRNETRKEEENRSQV